MSVHRPETGVFDLIIDNVTASDAGIYQCRENNGRYPGEACTEVVISAGESNLTSYLSSLLQGLLTLASTVVRKITVDIQQKFAQKL